MHRKNVNTKIILQQNSVTQHVQEQMGVKLLNILDFQRVLLLSQVLTGKFFLQLLYLGCTSNQRSIPF